MAKLNSDGVIVINNEGKKDMHVNDVLEQVIATRNIEEAKEADPVDIDISGDTVKTNLSVEIKSIITGQSKKPLKTKVNRQMIDEIMEDSIQHISHKEFGKMLRKNVLVESILRFALEMGTDKDTNMEDLYNALNSRELGKDIRNTMFRYYNGERVDNKDMETNKEVSTIEEATKDLEDAMEANNKCNDNNEEFDNSIAEFLKEKGCPEDEIDDTVEKMKSLSMDELFEKFSDEEEDDAQAKLGVEVFKALEMKPVEFMKFISGIDEENPDDVMGVLFNFLSERYNVAADEIRNLGDKIEDRLVSAGNMVSEDMILTVMKEIHEQFKGNLTQNNGKDKESNTNQQVSEPEINKEGKVKVYDYNDIALAHRNLSMFTEIRSTGFTYVNPEYLKMRA